jgi:hypothetical protein
MRSFIMLSAIVMLGCPAAQNTPRPVGEAPIERGPPPEPPEVEEEAVFKSDYLPQGCSTADEENRCIGDLRGRCTYSVCSLPVDPDRCRYGREDVDLLPPASSGDDTNRVGIGAVLVFFSEREGLQPTITCEEGNLATTIFVAGSSNLGTTAWLSLLDAI